MNVEDDDFSRNGADVVVVRVSKAAVSLHDIGGSSPPPGSILSR